MDLFLRLCRQRCTSGRSVKDDRAPYSSSACRGTSIWDMVPDMAIPQQMLSCMCCNSTLWPLEGVCCRAASQEGRDDVS